MTDTHAPRLLTIKSFCNRHEVSRATVYRLRDRGEIAFVKIGRATRIRSDDADAWARSLPVEGR